MATDANSQVNRRGFLKGAAAGAAGAAALTVPGVAPVGADSQLPAEPRAAFTPEQAARTLASETAPLPDEPDVQTVEDPGSDFMVDVLKTLGFEYIAVQSGVELQRAPRVVHQLRRQQGARVADVLPRAGVGEHRERLLRGGRQADGGHHLRAVGLAPRDDGDLRRLLGTHADVHPRGEHPRREGAAAAVRLGRAFRHGPRGHGSRHGQVGRHAGIAAALRGVGRPCLQDGDDRAARAGRARRRRDAAGESRSRQVQAPHTQVDARDSTGRRFRSRVRDWRSCSSLPRIR